MMIKQHITARNWNLYQFALVYHIIAIALIGDRFLLFTSILLMCKITDW